jgi:hypothetical protein
MHTSRAYERTESRYTSRLPVGFTSISRITWLRVRVHDAP